jgi:hypothetical protein
MPDPEPVCFSIPVSAQSLIVAVTIVALWRSRDSDRLRVSLSLFSELRKQFGLVSIHSDEPCGNDE